MSDYIPFEIQEEIMKRLPVKSLIQYRLVCKLWKSLIDSSEFVADYSISGKTNKHQHYLLVSYRDMVYSEHKYVSIVNDESFFSQPKVSVNVPAMVNQLADHIIVISSSQGLLFVYGYYLEASKSFLRGQDALLKRYTAVIWNPSIKKSVAISVPRMSWPYETVVGFGVCPVTLDPKIVKIIWFRDWGGTENTLWDVQVFTLTSGGGDWRSPSISSCNLPGESITFSCWHETIGGFIYWLASTNYGFYLIMSFDLTSEEFKPINLPYNLASAQRLSTSKLMESLAVIEYNKEADKEICDVWMMDGVTNLFTKQYTIRSPYEFILIHGFRRNGEPIMETQDDVKKQIAALEVYDLPSEHINEVGIYGKEDTFSVSSYMETLLLHDH